jgi:hypothetical protein
LNPVRDAHIVRLIEQISDHYRTNISNRFIRPSLLQLSLEKEIWDQIEILTEKFEQFRYQGFHLDELYRQIIAAAHFVSVTRRELEPFLKHRLGSSSSNADKVLRDMAINNFGSNLQVFAELLNELFLNLVEIDKAAAKGRKPLYQQIAALNDISATLLG